MTTQPTARVGNKYPKPMSEKETKKKIADLMERQYAGYRGRKLKDLAAIHIMIWANKTDEEFLSMLEKQEIENPRPIYNTLNFKQ